MEFTIEDRDMLKAHDAKLESLCSSVSTANDGIDSIIEKLNESTVGCAENRKNCLTEINQTFVRSRTFWSVLGLMTTGTMIIIAVVALII